MFNLSILNDCIFVFFYSSFSSIIFKVFLWVLRLYCIDVFFFKYLLSEYMYLVLYCFFYYFILLVEGLFDMNFEVKLLGGINDK